MPSKNQLLLFVIVFFFCSCAEQSNVPVGEVASEEKVQDGDGILMEILPDGSRVRHPYENGKETLN